MATFYMYVGISGSGKTYIAHKQHGKDAVIIDSDDVRARICPGGAEDQTMNSRVFEHMYKETCECLNRNISVCYTATNLSAKRRISLLKSLRKRFKNLECICYIINTPIDTCYERNAARERQVPEYVIGRQLQSFQIPCEAEGWDKIEVVNNYDDDDNSEKQLFKIVDKVMRYGSQHNKHHSLTLFGHCTKCGRLAEEKGYGDTLQQAAYIHDYGKIHTAIRWPDKDNDLHYPNHAQVGAYLALNMGYSLYVAQLVGAHMYPYTNEREQEVWKVRFGKAMWQDVLRLHECDCNAH